MKFKIAVIIILLFVALAAAIFFHSPEEYERQFRGVFVREFHGNIYQTEKESCPFEQI